MGRSLWVDVYLNKLILISLVIFFAICSKSWAEDRYWALEHMECKKFLKICEKNVYHSLCEGQASFVQGMITGLNYERQDYMWERNTQSRTNIKYVTIEYCERNPDKDTVDAAVHIYTLLVKEECGDNLLC